jgi:hypothetical protein
MKNGKVFNGSVKFQEIKQTTDVNLLIDEIYDCNMFKDENITKENSVVVSISKL